MDERKTLAPGSWRGRRSGVLDAGPFAADIASFRLHLAAENKAAATIRFSTDAACWFAASHLLAETDMTRWVRVEWLSLEVEPDPVCQQREAGDLRWPGVAGAAGLWALITDDHRGGADRDEHITVLALGGNDEGTACDECHVGAVGPARVQVQADEFCDIAGGGLAGNLRRGALLDDAAAFEDDEPIC
jgi:hypothetical protein